MRKGILIIGFLLAASSAFAQSWLPGQYTEFKGVIANEVLRLPRRDTIALGGNKDSIGQVVYRPQDTIAYIKTPVGWRPVGSAIRQPDDIEVVFDASNAWTDEYDLPILAGKRFRVYRRGVGFLISTEWQPVLTGGIKLITPGDLFGEGEILSIIFY